MKISPIKTPHALCIKIEYLYKIPLDESDFIFIDVKISNENLKQLNMFVAAENTWQGVTYRNWPYNQIPLKIVGKISDSGIDYSLTWRLNRLR